MQKIEIVSICCIQSKIIIIIHLIVKMEKLPKNMIWKICEYLNKKQICSLNLTCKKIRYMATSYMMTSISFVYDCEKMFKNMTEEQLNMCKKTYFKNIKNIRTRYLKDLHNFGNQLLSVIHEIPRYYCDETIASYGSDDDSDNINNFSRTYTSYCAFPKYDNNFDEDNNDVCEIELSKKIEILKELTITEFQQEVDDDDIIHLKSVSHVKLNNMNYMNNLKKLTLNINVIIDNFDFKNLEELSLGHNFISSIKHFNCPKLLKLETGELFSEEIEHFNMQNLLELSLGDNFNESIAKLNCSKLLKLKLGYTFEQPLHNCHFPDLLELTCGGEFNEPIENTKFHKLKKLYLHADFNHPIENLDCQYLEILQFSDNSIFNYSIEKLRCLNLKKVYLGAHFTQPIGNLMSNNLREIGFCGNSKFNESISDLDCSNITKILFGNSFNQPIEDKEFPKLITLSLGNSFDQSLKKLKCPNLEKIILNGNSKQHVLLNDLNAPKLMKIRIYKWESSMSQIKDIKEKLAIKFPNCEIVV